MWVVRSAELPVVVRIKTPRDVIVAVPCQGGSEEVSALARLVLSSEEFDEFEGLQERPGGAIPSGGTGSRERHMADAEAFTAHRDQLTAVAYRMLGSRADAQDAVQEAWLRYAAADPTDLVDLRAWLTTVTARICLDQLRSARVRREVYVGPWLPEPIVQRLPDSGWGDGFGNGPGDGFGDPAELAARTDEVSLALLTMMERLNPEQRVALVLHDVFAVPFDEIARVLSTTPAAARQLASRARRAVTTDGIRHTRDRAQQLAVLSAFLVAVSTGDIDALLAVLAPDVVAIGDGGGVAPAARQPVRGALQVARFMAGLFRRAQRSGVVAEPVLVNGDLGLLIEGTEPDGRELRVVMCFAVADGRITAVFDQLNPDKLIRVPRADPAHPSSQI